MFRSTGFFWRQPFSTERYLVCTPVYLPAVVGAAAEDENDIWESRRRSMDGGRGRRAAEKGWAKRTRAAFLNGSYHVELRGRLRRQKSTISFTLDLPSR